MIYPLMLATNDSLGATIPPAIAVHMGWPDRIFVNGALAGGLALVTETEDPNAVPDWMLARLTIDVMGDPADMRPGQTSDRTSLYQEGAGETSAPALLTAFCRYFLNWLDRWQRDGLKPLAPAFLDRAAGRDEATGFPDGERVVQGKPLRLTDDGDLVIETKGGERTVALSGLLDGPSWEL